MFAFEHNHNEARLFGAAAARRHRRRPSDRVDDDCPSRAYRDGLSRPPRLRRRRRRRRAQRHDRAGAVRILPSVTSQQVPVAQGPNPHLVPLASRLSSLSSRLSPVTCTSHVDASPLTSRFSPLTSTSHLTSVPQLFPLACHLHITSHPHAPTLTSRLSPLRPSPSQDFLKTEVEAQQQWGAAVSVKWQRGHAVTLVFYDEADAEVERHNIEGWATAKVRDTLNARGRATAPP